MLPVDVDNEARQMRPPDRAISRHAKLRQLIVLMKVSLVGCLMFSLMH